MKTVIFTRGQSAAQQIRVCEEYAKANGLEIVYTAKNEQDLTRFVLSGNVECVIVSEVSRISRRRDEYIESERMFNKFGVTLIAAGGTI